ncbi:MAG: hypothetical protein QM619_04135 [Micropruina sp.]|uniref:hypothetical protein n=1 Tax=Micropruina sp. TaxID=2737536 RepID=UPI0039E4B985
MRAITSAKSAGPRSTWVDAAPFRAHVRHATSVADVPWPVVAMAAGVSLSVVRALLVGRAGRPMTRIEPRLAAQLLRVDADELSALRVLRVPATLTTERLRGLLADGFPPLRLAQWCQIGPDELALLVDGDTLTCTRLTETLALAAERLRDADQHRPSTAA